MDIEESKVESIFSAALAIELREERTAYLNKACENDERLRRRVEKLLDAHSKLGSFIQGNAAEFAVTADMPAVTEGPGTVIGPYKLREQIGEGGMGVVFVAEQERPVRRKVALKIIKPGMDTREVIARLEAERQALAMMDHPNIARMLDAGSTQSGRPYFVMELVRGIPITEYCDRNKLSVRERLGLFTEVCRAIQHAHQKGIIYRDVKPSNILVGSHDGRPVPKVIDFGVAKAINQRLTERTIYTQFAQIIGTPMYMSPEQAELSGLDVDTRSDIYSLGVLLYELLTGVPPFEEDRLRKAAYDEMRRIIREEEPPKPSTKITTLGPTAGAVSEQRKSDPHKLLQQVRGDLDWIVMKSLEKDRTRRYDTASGLAADVKRSLDNEPIEARPPSTWYRLGKYARRHRGLVASVAAVILVLVLGMAGTTISSVIAWQGWKEADQQRLIAQIEKERADKLVGEYQHELIEKALLHAMSGDLNRAIDVITKAREAGVSEGWVRFIHGVARHYRGDVSMALEDSITVVEMEPENGAAQAMLALARLFTGSLEDYKRELRKLDAIEPRDEYGEYDALFAADARIYADPQAAAKKLRTLVNHRPSWSLARVILAESLGHAALDAGDPDLAKEALEEIQSVEPMFQDYGFVLVHSCFIHAVAARLEEQRGNSADELWKAADDLVARSERFDGHLSATMRACYFDFYRCDEEAAAREWRKVTGQNLIKNDTIAAMYIASLYERDNLEEAISQLPVDEAQWPAAHMSRAFVMAEMPDGHDKAIAVFDRLTKARESLSARCEALKILLKMGCWKEAKEVAVEWLNSYDEEGLNRSFLAYVAEVEEVDEDRLLDIAGQSRNQQCDAHFLIGLKLLAEGNASARQHFEACEDTLQMNRISYCWARALLSKTRPMP